jgi:hypothetical protein
MNVVYTGRLAITGLAANTIYVLTGPISTGNATINMERCNAVVSNQATGTTFYSTAQLTSGMFAMSGKRYTIFDFINLE